MREIYLDNAAATPLDPRVKKEMIRAMDLVGNPSAYNDASRIAAEELTNARKKIARFLGAHEDEVIFTASGSEANTLAIFGTAAKAKKGQTGIITTPIEHLSVLEPLRALEKTGTPVRYIKVDHEGWIHIDDLEKMLNNKTNLVSVMYANNEIGTVQPIKRIGKIIQAKKKNGRPLFHVDACQATGYLPMNVNELGVDILTFNGSKIYGPRGMGVLYVRRGTPIAPQILGGGQEHGLRAGTENLPAIVGLAKAVALIDQKKNGRLAKLQEYFLGELKKILPDAKINGALGNDRLPNNINVSIPGLDSETLLLELDKYGIRAGSGSACMARSVEPSHVLKAIGVKKPYLDGALRFSLGRQTTRKEIAYLLNVLPKIVQVLKKRYQD